MLFDCAVLYYIDKFGENDLSEAVEKIFIWSYTPRIFYEVLQMASVDNYVVREFNLFKILRGATHREEVLQIELPPVSQKVDSPKTKAIKDLFIEMKYYEYK